MAACLVANQAVCDGLFCSQMLQMLEYQHIILVLQVSLCGIHRDPDVWGNPDEYVPERWIEGAPEQATEVQKKVCIEHTFSYCSIAQAGGFL